MLWSGLKQKGLKWRGVEWSEVEQNGDEENIINCTTLRTFGPIKQKSFTRCDWNMSANTRE